MSPLGPKKKGIRFNLYWMYSLIALVLIGLYYMNDNTMSKEVNWTEFEKIAKEGGITRLTVFAKKDYAEAQLNDSTAKAVFKTDKINGKPVIYTNIPSGDSFAKTLDTWKKEDGFNAEVYYENSSDLTNILWSVGPFILLIVFWIYLARRMTNQGGGGSGGVFNVGKAKAQLFDKDGAVKVTFNDVAGLSEAKQEVEEIVEFLKNPNRYTDLGGKIPKGALLVGPPGTGKTLLAKAVAGEANVPFFSLSGSDFVEMFVGVGASRVRDLFAQAKKNAPCIVFIDEIDAVGRQRGSGLGGGHDEREQTLNQLLVEMDGFGSNEGIITIAATNRPDILDPALLRPGRFDRRVVVGRPDLRGRLAILRVHARNKPLEADVDLNTIAKKIPGFTGADIANLLNEAALLAARQNRKTISMADLEEASEKVSYGPERKSHKVSDEERKLTAYHESGHAIMATLLPDADPVHKVTIIPRGQAGGYTMMLPREERSFITKSHLLAQLRVALGGRCAEKIIFDEISSGASGDLQQVTGILRKMIMEWGMSDRLGPMIFGEHQEQIFLGKQLGSERNYGETVATIIDEEMHKYLNEALNDTMQMLTDNIEVLHAMAKALMEVETINHHQVENLFKYHSIYSPDEQPAPASEDSPLPPVPGDGENPLYSL